MKATSHRFSVEGRDVRVVVAGDAVALPDEGWSCGGFGRTISTHWLLTAPPSRLPGPAARRKMFAACIVQALEDHHAAADESVDSGVLQEIAGRMEDFAAHVRNNPMLRAIAGDSLAQVDADAQALRDLADWLQAGPGGPG